jgi:hypothetical protein
MHSLTLYGTPEARIKKVDATLDSKTESDRVTLTNPGRAFQWALMGSSLVSPLEWPKTGSQ